MAGEDLQELSPEDAEILGLMPLDDAGASERGLTPVEPEPDLQELSPEMAAQRGLIPLSPDQAREQGLTPLAEAESAPDAFWREARHSLLPSLAALPAAGAGAKAGAIAGAAGGPFAWATVPAGAIAGGVAGALGGGYLVSELQEWALKKLGMSDAEQRGANIEEHPYSSFAGQLAPAVVAFNPGKLTMKISERLLGGGIQGGIEAGQELAHEGTVDPYKVAAATAFGAVLANPNRLGRRLIGAGERHVPGEYPDRAPHLGPRVRPEVDTPPRADMTTGPEEPRNPPGRPDLEPRPTAEAEKAEATVSQPPREGQAGTEPIMPARAADTVGDPHNAPTRSSREYPKGAENEAVILRTDEARPVPEDQRYALNPDEYPQAARLGEENVVRPEQRPAEIASERQLLDPDEYIQRGQRGSAEVETGLAEVAQARGQTPEPLVTAAVTSRLTRPTVVTRAIERARQTPGHENIAKALDGVTDPKEAMQVATKYLRATQNQSGTIKNTGQAGLPAEYATARVPAKVARVEELGVTARSKADAARKSGAIQAARRAFEDFPPPNDQLPTSKADIAALKKRLGDALERARGAYGGNDPLSYRPREKPAEWLWLRAAKRIVEAKRLTPRQVAEFIATEKQLRSGVPEDVANVRATGRIAGDIARSRRSGEEVILSTENEQARQFPGEIAPAEDAPGGVVERIGEDPIAREAYPDLPEQMRQADEYDANLRNEVLPRDTTAGDRARDITPPAKEVDLANISDEDLAKLHAERAQPETETPEWKRLQQEREDSVKANLARLRELRAAKTNKAPPVSEVLTALISDESGAGSVPQWLGNMFGPQSQRATMQQARRLEEQITGPTTIKTWGLDAIARHSDPYWGGKKNNPVRDYELAANEAVVKARDLHEEASPMLENFGKLHDLHQRAGWRDFVDLIYDEGRFQVYADRPLTTKDQGFRVSEWGRAKHADLEARFKALEQAYPDLAAARKEWLDYAMKVRKAEAQHIGENKIWKLAKIDDPPLVKRIIDGTETQADVQLLGQDLIDVLRKHVDKGFLEGPYVPQNRWGNYVLTGKYDIPTPANALRQVKDNSWTFGDKAHVDAFVSQLDLQPSIRIYHADAQGNETYIANGKEYRYTAADAASDPTIQKRWDVTVNDNYMEKMDLRRQGMERQAELRDSGAFKPDSLVLAPERFNPKTDAVALAENLGMNSLRGNKYFQNLTKHQQELLRQTLAEEYLQSMAATRGGSSKVHRSNVAGFEKDFLRATAQYVQESGHRLAGYEFRPKMDDAMEKIKSTAGEDNKFADARTRVYNELAKRDATLQNDAANYNMHATVVGRALHRVLVTSQMARLATLGYSIRNLTQQVVFGAPYIEARWGAGSSGEMFKVAREIGALKLLGEGIKATGRAAMGKDHPATFFEDAKRGLRDKFSRDMADRFRESNVIDGDAGFMVHEFAASKAGVQLDLKLKRGNKALEAVEKGLTAGDRAIEWGDNVSRQLPRAVEMTMRMQVGIAAARLEFRKTGDADLAFIAGRDAINETMFQYHDVNKAPFQKHATARLPLQFKQFGFSAFALIGSNLGKAISRQSSPAERAAGIKTLAGIAVATTAFAGILGLPTEPFRMLLLAAKTAGLTDKDWDDVELKVREFTNAVAGKAGGEALAKGLPRLLNIDLSTGVGLDNMLVFGSPRAGTDRDFDNNLQAWIGQTLVGAPGTMIMQMARGLRSISTGDYMKGAQDLIPVKTVSDTARAVRQYREGTKSPSGRQLSAPYSAYEAGLRVAGLPPGREAEEQFHRRLNVSHDFTERDQRGRLINAWMTAAPNRKADAYRAAIQGGVTGRDLTQAYRRRLSQERREVGATVPTKRNRPFAEHSRDVLNLPSERRALPPR